MKTLIKQNLNFIFENKFINKLFKLLIPYLNFKLIVLFFYNNLFFILYSFCFFFTYKSYLLTLNKLTLIQSQNMAIEISNLISNFPLNSNKFEII